MISLEKIISSNLDMLKQQEAELTKSLSFVKRAIELFRSQNGSKPIVRSSRKAIKSPVTKVQTAKPTAKPSAKSFVPRKGSHIEGIMSLLKQKGGAATSNEIVNHLFKKQKKVKKFGTFRQQTYNVLSKAYKKGRLKNQNGKISFA